MQDKNTEMLQLPMNVFELMVDNWKKNAELSMNFFKALEKNQRDFMKAGYDMLNVATPGEAKLWDMQTNVMEKTIEVTEKSYEKLMSMWK